MNTSVNLEKLQQRQKHVQN